MRGPCAGSTGRSDLVGEELPYDADRVGGARQDYCDDARTATPGSREPDYQWLAWGSCGRKTAAPRPSGRCRRSTTPTAAGADELDAEMDVAIW